MHGPDPAVVNTNRWNPSQMVSHHYLQDHETIITEVMESLACIKQPQGHGRHVLEVTFSWNVQWYYLWGQETVPLNICNGVTCTVVVYTLELTPLMFTICRIIVVRLVVWAIACLIQLSNTSHLCLYVVLHCHPQCVCWQIIQVHCLWQTLIHVVQGQWWYSWQD